MILLVLQIACMFALSVALCALVAYVAALLHNVFLLALGVPPSDDAIGGRFLRLLSRRLL
jgi:hypothetical protein